MLEKARRCEKEKCPFSNTDTSVFENFSQSVLYIFCFWGLPVLITFVFISREFISLTKILYTIHYVSE